MTTQTDLQPENPHANDAAPYGGGDPYADYRTFEHPFTELVDLADRRLGAGIVAANDELFAERENLLVRERSAFDPEHFGHKGKIMDGWETRRRRGTAADPFPAPEDHDWALIRLGAPGVIRGIIVDTAHFRGNYPQRVSVQAASVEGSPSPEELLADDVKWEELLPPTPVRGHAANGFEITSARPITGLPSGCPPKTASAAMSWTRSWGVSSTIAISSSTTSRSESSSSNVGR